MWLLIGFIIVFFVFYVWTRLSTGITRSNACLIGKTAIVTGANSGLGYQAALNLASRGCRIIMADVANMEQSVVNIIKYTSNTNIIAKKLDLSSLSSVRDFASEVLKTEKRLDILINNAGVGASRNDRTKDDLHPLMQINYFGHFLLTHLLMDLLKKSAPSRIVFTSSHVAFLSDLTLDTLNINCSTSNPYKNLKIYGNSKLAIIIASDIFAEKLKGTGVTSNCVHPGFSATQIYMKSFPVKKSFQNKIILFLIESSFALFAKDTWKGSQTLVHTAISNKLKKATGQYFSDCKSFFKPRSAYNKHFCKCIWEATEKFVCLTENEKL